jgi:hypothetical protein
MSPVAPHYCGVLDQKKQVSLEHLFPLPQAIDSVLGATTLRTKYAAP